jgi:GT2 family glycosyltransferase
MDSYDFICHEADIMAEGHRVGRMKCRSLNGNVYEDLLTLGNTIITSSVCVKREIVASLGGFPEIKELVAVEDFDLWLRIAKAGYTFKVIHEPLGIYNVGAADNISVAGEKDILRLQAVYNRYIPGFIYEQKARGILNYLTAVLENKMGKIQEAAAHYREAIRDGRPSVKIKALIRLTLLYIKKK